MNGATALDADEAFFAALLAADRQALDLLLAEDFALVDVMAGQMVPRDVFLGLVATGQLTFLRWYAAPRMYRCDNARGCR